MPLNFSMKLLFYASLAHLVTGQTTSVDYCVALEGVIQICAASTSGWLNLPASQQASCACGSFLGTIPWGPMTYDQLASDCASQYATIDATIASDARGLEGFCTSFVAQATSTLASATARMTTAAGSIQPQQTGTTGLFTSMTPTTVISVITVSSQATSSSSSKNAAEPAKNIGNQALGWILPFFGILIGVA